MDAKVRELLNSFICLGAVTALAISRDQKTLYIGSKDGEFIHIHLNDIGELDDIRADQSPSSVVITPDDRFLFSSEDAVITVWDLIEQKIHLRLLPSHQGT